MVALPTLVQVNFAVASVISERTPLLALQVYERVEGALSTSTALACSAIEPLTATSAGLASIPSMRGQALTVPFTRMLPFFG